MQNIIQIHAWADLELPLSEKIQILNIKLKYLQSPPSFFILVLIIAHDLKLSRKCENVFVFPSHVKILHDIFWLFPHKRISIFRVNYIIL